jgi:hypothetical protein
VLFADPMDHLQVHAAPGGGVKIPMERAHGLIWLPTTVALPACAMASAATASSGKRLWHSRLGHIGHPQLDELLTSHVEAWAMHHTRSWDSARPALCVSLKSAIFLVLLRTEMLDCLR